MGRRDEIPFFTERTSDGLRETNAYAKLYEGRIVFLGAQVDDRTANDIMAQLLHLEADQPDRDIELYVNSPGGSLTALMAIYDTMQYVRPNVATFCMGQAGPAAAVVFAAGAPGKRVILPNARVSIGQPAVEGIRGQTSDLEIQAAELSRMRALLEERLALHTGKPVTEIRRDIDRELHLTAEQAVQYGIADRVLDRTKKKP